MITIEPDTEIQKLVDDYPEVVDFLIKEYGFHCVNCLLSEFESLEEGARMHGIVGSDFEEMMDAVAEYIEQSGVTAST